MRDGLTLIFMSGIYLPVDGTLGVQGHYVCLQIKPVILRILIVISFILDIGNSVFGLSVMASGLFLEQWRPTTVRQRLEDSPSLTELHLSISKSSSKDSLLNTLNLGVLASIQIGPRDRALCVDLGAIITPHSPGHPKVYSPRNAYMLVKSK